MLSFVFKTVPFIFLKKYFFQIEPFFIFEKVLFEKSTLKEFLEETSFAFFLLFKYFFEKQFLKKVLFERYFSSPEKMYKLFCVRQVIFEKVSFPTQILWKSTFLLKSLLSEYFLQ